MSCAGYQTHFPSPLLLWSLFLVELDPLWGELLLGLLDLDLERGLLVLSEVFLYLVLLYWMWPDWKLGFLITVFFLDSLDSLLAIL